MEECDVDKSTIEPTLEEREEQPCVSIPIEVTLEEWSEANALVGEVYGWLAGRDVEPAGALFYRYRVVGDVDEAFDLEVGVPVAGPVEGDGRVQSGVKHAGKYLVYTHHGHPDQLANVHDELQAWARERDFEFERHGQEDTWAGRYESYFTDPAEQPNPNEWTIEVAYQVRDDTVR